MTWAYIIPTRTLEYTLKNLGVGALVTQVMGRLRRKDYWALLAIQSNNNNK